jgi:hypothetical protein
MIRARVVISQILGIILETHGWQVRVQRLERNLEIELWQTQRAVRLEHIVPPRTVGLFGKNLGSRGVLFEKHVGF